MKIKFSDGGYIEAQETSDGIYLLIAAPKADSKELIVNSAEVTLDEFVDLVSDLKTVRLITKGKQ